MFIVRVNEYKELKLFVNVIFVNCIEDVFRILRLRRLMFGIFLRFGIIFLKVFFISDFSL